MTYQVSSQIMTLPLIGLCHIRVIGNTVADVEAVEGPVDIHIRCNKPVFLIQKTDSAPPMGIKRVGDINFSPLLAYIVPVYMLVAIDFFFRHIPRSRSWKHHDNLAANQLLPLFCCKIVLIHQIIAHFSCSFQVFDG